MTLPQKSAWFLKGHTHTLKPCQLECRGEKRFFFSRTKEDLWHAKVSDVRSQLRFLEEVESLKKKRRERDCCVWPEVAHTLRIHSISSSSKEPKSSNRWKTLSCSNERPTSRPWPPSGLARRDQWSRREASAAGCLFALSSTATGLHLRWHSPHA
ncbi:uncharacterized protein LOC130193651 isoform X2 [Pseudoliparis swirei]|uniref:uncharacterized protein LOC130193651 isoform X2 n=1 Tax=Pseudoliparis swirei TaxID=2059687 RepID=UPI0024BE1AD9|nr:uncharacterized protein LOC130193651 isoform X2 [Pseudoliparis swirei]